MQILVVSPRVAPGLLTLSAWDALRAAASVRATELDDPHVEAIVTAGIAVEATPDAPSYEADVVWIAPTGDVGWAQQVATDLVDGASPAEGGGHIEIIFGSYDQPGSRLLDLVEVMDQLRTQCPWTKQQTHASLSHYLLEEAYETLESLDSGDTDHLREELGDLLMQVVFHARIAAESEGWDIDTVAEGIVAKLIYRNPHVFGDETVASADEVDANWQALKAVEKQRSSPLDGIPAHMPALAFADKVLGRIGDVAVDGDDFGSRLLALVQEARADGVNAEEALRKAVHTLL
ncbi:MAG: MazG family protein [Actinomycetota bacterium]|nr:MazG family protein [Actinomycetota bacterium]